VRGFKIIAAGRSFDPRLLMRTLRILLLFVTFIFVTTIPQRPATANGSATVTFTAVEQCGFQPVEMAKAGPASCATTAQLTGQEWLFDSKLTVCRCHLTAVFGQVSVTIRI